MIHNNQSTPKISQTKQNK